MPIAEAVAGGRPGGPWSVLVLAGLGVLALVLGWLYAVAPWYVGAVLLGLALAALVARQGWPRLLHLPVIAVVAALIAVPALIRPADGAEYLVDADQPRVSAGEDVLITLEFSNQVSRLSAWSRTDGEQLWSMTEDASTAVDSPYPLPLVSGDLLLTGTLSLVDAVDGWPSLGALDLATGQQLWRSEVTGAVLGSDDGVLVVATPERTMAERAPGTLRGLDLATGEVLWTHEGVLPTGGLPMVATDSDDPRWGGQLPVTEDLPLLALRDLGPDGEPRTGAELIDPATGESLAQVPAEAADGVLVVGEHAVVVGDSGSEYRLTGYDASGERAWRTEVDADDPDVNGLDQVASGAVMTAGDRVLLRDASAALDLNTGQVVDYPVRPVPDHYDDMLIGPDYAVTTAVTDAGYYAVLNLASGELSAIPGELSGTERPTAFYGGERAALMYSDVVDRPFGRTLCRVRVLDVTTMTTSEHLLGECTEAAEVKFWGEDAMAAVDGGWAALGAR